MRRLLISLPLLLTLALVAFTAAVFRQSHYGTWHVYPVLALAPAVVLLHAVLIARAAPRTPYVMYAVMHLLAFAPLWLWCVMRVAGE